MNRKKMQLSSLFLFVLFPGESKVINKLLKRMWGGGDPTLKLGTEKEHPSFLSSDILELENFEKAVDSIF
jgi:hypothetical protein